MTEPLVSILIPAFNAEEWIADSLESAIRQTWQPTEIIVIDDGSQDRTAAIAERFAVHGVSVVRQRNAGAAAARNTAFSISRGDYIQWLDADDLLAPDKIAAQMQVAYECNSQRTLLSSAWGRFLYRPSKARFVPTPLWCDLTPVEWMRRQMDLNLHMQTATWLVSRELTIAAGPWNTDLLGDDDGEYFSRVLLQSDGVRFQPKARVFYRMAGPASLSYIGRSHKKLDAQFHSMRLHIDHIRSLEDSETIRATCVTYLQRWLGHFHPERPDIVKQTQQLAADLGGRVTMPDLSWKYAWIRPFFGETVAMRAQPALRNAKWLFLRKWDKLLSRFEHGVTAKD